MEKCRLICKECNKEYASKQSLCNHMTNIHKNKKHKVSNPLDELINNNIISELIIISEQESYVGLQPLN